MLDRKALDTQAQTLLEAHQFRDGNGELLSTNADIFRDNLHRELSVYREFAADCSDEDKLRAALKPVKRACTWYNDEMRMQRLEQLKTLGPRLALVSYLGSQRISGLKVEEDKKEDTIKVEPNLHVGLDAVDFYSYMCSADYDYIRDVCCIFADNIARRKVVDDKEGDGKNVFVTKESIHESYIALRKKLAEKMGGWDFDDPAKISNKELQREMCYVVARLCFLPTEDIDNERWLIKMINADWRWFRDTICVTNGGKKASDNEEKKGTTNSGGKYIIRDESTIIRTIFQTMYTRYHGLTYDYVIDNNSVDKSRVSEPNRDMAESSKVKEFTKTETPEAGEITLGTPEA